MFQRTLLLVIASSFAAVGAGCASTEEEAPHLAAEPAAPPTPTTPPPPALPLPPVETSIDLSRVCRAPVACSEVPAGEWHVVGGCDAPLALHVYGCTDSSFTGDQVENARAHAVGRLVIAGGRLQSQVSLRQEADVLLSPVCRTLLGGCKAAEAQFREGATTLADLARAQSASARISLSSVACREQPDRSCRCAIDLQVVREADEALDASRLAACADTEGTGLTVSLREVVRYDGGEAALFSGPLQLRRVP